MCGVLARGAVGRAPAAGVLCWNRRPPVYLLIVKNRQGGFLYGIGSILAILTLAWSLGPLFVFLYCRRLRRMLKGQYLACGYDLRGLSQMRCPECGRPFTFEEVHATAEGLQFAGRTSPQAPANS